MNVVFKTFYVKSHVYITELDNKLLKKHFNTFYNIKKIKYIIICNEKFFIWFKNATQMIFVNANEFGTNNIKQWRKNMKC